MSVEPLVVIFYTPTLSGSDVLSRRSFGKPHLNLSRTLRSYGSSSNSLSVTSSDSIPDLYWPSVIRTFLQTRGFSYTWNKLTSDWMLIDRGREIPSITESLCYYLLFKYHVCLQLMSGHEHRWRVFINCLDSCPRLRNVIDVIGFGPLFVPISVRSGDWYVGLWIVPSLVLRRRPPRLPSDQETGHFLFPPSSNSVSVWTGGWT